MDRVVSSIMAAIVVAAPVMAADPDVVGINPQQAGLKVIDEKCLQCHNRQRIEESARKKENVDQILRRMEKKGAVVTAKERDVMGHFWQQNPFKSK